MTSPVRAPTPGPPHHAVDLDEVALALASHPRDGLSEDEARERLARHGPNRLPQGTGSGLPRRILRQFHHPLIYVLLAAGGITAAIGERVDSAVILAVVLLNALIGFVQESRAEGALDALRSMAHTQARVVRGGRVRGLDSEELVPGDLVVLEAGDKVPADLRLAGSTELRVDESALTGESVPVRKGDAVLADDVPVADRRNMAYSGTLVTTGAAVGIVVATGAGTQLGEIHRLVGAAETLATPLTEKLAAFSRVLTVAILGLAAATFAVGLLRGMDAATTFTAAIALAVGAIPEGLPAAVTITLAIGVARMARRRAVIRRLPAVEALGSTTVICSDKTGTLTRNQMTVRQVWTPSARYQVTGSGYGGEGEVQDGAGVRAHLEADPGLRWSLLAGVGCSDATVRPDRAEIVGDPTEAALLVVAAKAGIGATEVADRLPRVATIPFGSERQFMATLHDRSPTERVVLVKGAVERVLDLCETQLGRHGEVEPLDRDLVLREAEDLARQGLRVLATAMRRVERSGGATGPLRFDADHLPQALTLTGLQAMLDPPHSAVVAAVGACRGAGIAVKMITGDHAATATAIAVQVGVLDGDGPWPGAVLTGAELAALPVEELAGRADRARVFARVTPEQKLRLVEALQSLGHVVAMTGDGVNDAPALRQAGIGVAMGRMGTEVAKDAADVVLVDDDFGTIEAAVEEGRGVFDNLTKFLTWTLPTNIGEGLVILAAIVAGASLPILPTQILWINMTTAVALGLMLAFEPKEADIMTRPPRDPDQPLLTGTLMTRILLVSGLLVAGSWCVFAWEQGRGSSLPEARTAAVNVFVAVEALYLFSCRSLTRSAWRVGLFSNRWVVVGVLTQAAGQLALTYLPAMNRVFHTAPIGWDSWLAVWSVAVATSLVVAAEKGVRARRASPPDR